MDGTLGDIITEWLEQLGLTVQYAEWVKNVIIVILIVILVIFLDKVAKHFLIRSVIRIARKTQTRWDDRIVSRRVFHRLTHLLPAIVLYFLLPSALRDMPTLLNILQAGVKIYMAVVVLLSLDALLNAFNDIYQTYEISKTKPVKGYIQVVKILLYAVTGIIVISILLGKSPYALLAGLGAMTAVLLLIFKDTILGLVGSVQLSANDMVRMGDWISMPDFNADGIVEEITLATVKVRNWDRTISTVPTYAMLTNSFQNWRGMQESGGRRIMRSIKLDQNTIRFLEKEDIEKLKKIHILKDYIEAKQEELHAYNEKYAIDNAVKVNGRRQTNVGVLRAYLMEYLKRHPKINEGMLILVRHLEPGETGLPVQLYGFSSEQAWADYESVQADIFDHVLSVLSEFDLKVFQNPTGDDLRSLKQ
ncbi:MAG: mechanosensitive ion channel [Bacteroidales bacterium]